MSDTAYKHDWEGTFWDRVEGTKSKWTTECPFEDREVFELEIEALIEASLPQDLDELRRAYARCNWSERPMNAICDLENAILTGSYMDENLGNREILQQLKGIQLVSRPVQLPFPEEYLASFLQSLKYHAFLTLWTFIKERNTLLRELPPHLVSALHCELFQLAVRALMQALRVPC